MRAQRVVASLERSLLSDAAPAGAALPAGRGGPRGAAAAVFCAWLGARSASPALAGGTLARWKCRGAAPAEGRARYWLARWAAGTSGLVESARLRHERALGAIVRDGAPLGAHSSRALRAFGAWREAVADACMEAWALRVASQRCVQARCAPRFFSSRLYMCYMSLHVLYVSLSVAVCA